MGVKAPLCLVCPLLSPCNCGGSSKGGDEEISSPSSEPGDGVDRLLTVLVPRVAAIEGDDGGSVDRVK